jgi:hypothetical protein
MFGLDVGRSVAKGVDEVAHAAQMLSSARAR